MEKELEELTKKIDNLTETEWWWWFTYDWENIKELCNRKYQLKTILFSKNTDGKLWWTI